MGGCAEFQKGANSSYFPPFSIFNRRTYLQSNVYHNTLTCRVQSNLACQFKFPFHCESIGIIFLFVPIHLTRRILLVRVNYRATCWFLGTCAFNFLPEKATRWALGTSPAESSSLSPFCGIGTGQWQAAIQTFPFFPVSVFGHPQCGCGGSIAATLSDHF